MIIKQLDNNIQTKFDLNKKTNKFFAPKNVLLVLILILQILLIYVTVNPPNLFNQLNVVNVLNRVSEKVAVPPQELPVLAMIGDGKNLPKIDELKRLNKVNEEVYDGARDGDFVLLYSSKMVIYRSSEDRIIYEGDSPAAILQKKQQGLLSQIISLAKERNIVSTDSQEVPVLNQVTDPTIVRQMNPKFYQDVQVDDIVAIFNQSAKILIYRPSIGALVNSGSITTNIN